MPRTDTRERLLERSLQLFAVQGFHATGVKEIVDAVGMPKGSFYAHFDSKEALGCAVVDLYWLLATQKLQVLAEERVPPVDRLRGHFQQLAEDVVASDFTAGCLLGKFGIEIYDRDSPIRSRVSVAFRTWGKAIADVVTQAAKSGELAVKVAPKDAAAFLLNSWEGAVVRALTDRSAQPLKLFSTVAFASLFLEGNRQAARRDRGAIS